MKIKEMCKELGYNRQQMIDETKKSPSWIHFGAGNIFRAFPATVLDELLAKGICQKGVVVCEGFDEELLPKAYTPYDNLSLTVTLKADGTADKKLVGSVAETINLAAAMLTDAVKESAEYARLSEIFKNPSLQMISFTITEKGYRVNPANLSPKHLMAILTSLLYERFCAGQLPVAVVSMDNCSHNGDIVKAAVFAYAESWAEQGIVPAAFLAYLKDVKKVSFPWSMIDKITPRPDGRIKEMLEKDGFEDTDIIITTKNTYTSPFVNAEETQYLVIEDVFPNGRPALEEGGILFADRETVDKVEKMKVCTCLNPLHTALAIYGCMLGFTSICGEMKDKELSTLVERLGKEEGMPVVVNPGIIKPEDFLDNVLYKRLPNPFMPDTPQRIATDTSQKLSIRFGETVKAYEREEKDLSGLVCIPLVIAGYLRYLMGLDDNGEKFEMSPDPMLSELTEIMAGVKFEETADEAVLDKILLRTDIFGLDYTQTTLDGKIKAMYNEMNKKGGVRATLEKYL